MAQNIAVIVTSISGPNKVLQSLASGCKERGHNFIVIGDVPSPKDFALDGCDFYDLDRQIQSGFKFAELCPTRHYARKNIGYLVALSQGAEIIVETDDDNCPYESFWEDRTLAHTVKGVTETGWINAYKYFSDANIWPRGFVLDKVLSPVPDYQSLNTLTTECPIQQGLANENPDVDAIYRLTLPLPQNFRKDRRIALGKGTICPFNSQNTTWFPQAFMLMYLPAYCSFRMTDIWRSFVALRIAQENDWSLLFHEPTVYQERNEHDLMKDFSDEISGYLNNSNICKELWALDLQKGSDNMAANLKKCYKKLIEMELVGEKEMDLIDAWIEGVSDFINRF